MKTKKPRRALPVRPCAECNEIFTPRGNPQKICDQCNMVACGWCQKFIRRPPSQRNKQAIFCSLRCKGAKYARSAIAQKKSCEQCGSEYSNKNTRFCSQACKSKWLARLPKTYQCSEKQCKICGEAFQGGKSVVVCEPCHWATCSQCGVVFKKKAAYVVAAKKRNKTGLTFCGDDCRIQAKRDGKFPTRTITRTPRPCRWCGKVFKPNHNYNPKYCSNECRLEGNRNGGRKRWAFSRYYGSDWQEQRSKALERDKVCQRCRMDPLETGVKLHVHHIKPFRLFGYGKHKQANALSNLICLCPACHNIVEAEDVTPIQFNIFTNNVAW